MTNIVNNMDSFNINYDKEINGKKHASRMDSYLGSDVCP